MYNEDTTEHRASSDGRRVGAAKWRLAVFALATALSPWHLALAQTVQTIPGARDYVEIQSLTYELRTLAQNFGDWFLRTGIERRILTGEYVRGAETKGVPFRAVLELPGRARFEVQGTDSRTIGFDGTRNWSSKGGADSSDLQIMESLVNDSVEAFFLAIGRGGYYRAVAYRVRADDGKAAVYTGPSYDVYESVDPIARALDPDNLRPKWYLFNSTTGLLEMIRYAPPRGQSVSPGETQIQWTKADGQALPLKIIRVENGQPVFTLNVGQSILTSKATDGAFERP